MDNIITKIILIILILCFVVACWFVVSEIYYAESQVGIEQVVFEVKQGESVSELVDRLAEERIIRNPWLFKKYIVLKGLDKKTKIKLETGKKIGSKNEWKMRKTRCEKN